MKFKSRGIAAFAGMATTIICLAATPAAEAQESKPLEIAKFTMQTTAPTKMEPVGPGYEFINEPYSFTQAGGHPWALTATLEFASEEIETKDGQETIRVLVPTRDPKDVVVDLPPGLLGDPMAVPRCPLAQALARPTCPPSTQVGEYRLRWFTGKETIDPIVNVTPEAGQSAEFVLENEWKNPPVLTAHLVHTAQGYGFTVVSNGITPVELSKVETTFWGVPAASSHDPERGLFCASTARGVPITCSLGSGGKQSEVAPVPFLTMPTDCAAGPETATARADSWQEPGHVYEGQRDIGYVEAQTTMPAVTGCGLLAFNPAIEVQPDSLVADEPVGLGVNLKVPLSEQSGTNATPQLRNSTITFPEGMSVNPSVVDGIQACNELGPEGINITGPESEEVGLNGELQLAPGHCPAASTVGTAEAVIPLLPTPVKGHVYLARPACGGVAQPPCTEADALDGKLYRLYLELGGTGELAITGVHYKVAFDTEANPATGQLTTKVIETPQAPFSELKVNLKGGPRAPIANPAACGPAVTATDFTPWSAPGIFDGSSITGTSDATPTSTFQVEGCSSSTPFNPEAVAGTVTPNGGKFSAFTMNISRKDREQYVKGVQVHTPPGLLGMLSSVQLCGEAEADSGHCPEASKIGTTRVATGAGSHPFEVEGTIYLTGPYRGAPFGLSIVTNAVAGPFNLGLVVVRARIDVDPENSTLTVTTDETGPYALPQIIFGIPLRLQRITVDVDRSNFMFNPTNCAAHQITVDISGSQDAVVSRSSPFAVAGCDRLAFKPKFTVSTSANTSRAKGASLDVKLSYPAASVGSEANIARVKVDLPKQLPSQLKTLQKACPSATFAANPAACPQGSIVGIVKASTPLLPVGLSGPVYFVSHGGEAFPSLVVVLQGDGVRVDLTGATFINEKTNVTSSTFRAVPDVPVNSFELYLPQGKYPALAAVGKLCDEQSKLVMPTEFVAQNGAVLKQSTKISVIGCNTKKSKKTRKVKRGRAAQARGSAASSAVSSRRGIDR
jgi:hypothetical protein